MDSAKYEYQSEFARRYVSQGRIQGEANLVLRLLEKRFGPLPEGTEERVRSASLELLERWSDRLLTAASLDEVFAE